MVEVPLPVVRDGDVLIKGTLPPVSRVNCQSGHVGFVERIYISMMGNSSPKYLPPHPYESGVD